MHFPKYWTAVRGKDQNAWGWSDNSLDEATDRAKERLARIEDWLARGGKTALQHRYGYSDDRPLREKVLREFRGVDGTLRAAITRNSYGCLVLNTADLMFVDVDAPAYDEFHFISWISGRWRKKREAQRAAFAEGLLARVHDWVGRWQGWGWRVYRTAAGVRLLATHEPFASDAAMCHAAFEVFEADPLYRKLCATQKCFRARLTPKPWRCDADKPNVRWPWGDDKWEARFRKWEAQYNKAAARYATCKLIGQFGSSQFHPELRELIVLHDTLTQAGSDLRLA